MNKIHSCSVCFAELPDQARVCPSCGEAVPDAEWEETTEEDNPKGEMSSSEGAAPAENETGSDLDADEVEELGRGDEVLSGESGCEDVRGRVDRTASCETGPSNDEFVFQYDTLIPFCTGAVNCLSIRIDPKVELADVRLGIQPHYGKCDECLKRLVFDYVEKCWLADFDIEGLPAGTQSCDVSLRCRVGGICKEFTGCVRLAVLDRDRNCQFNYQPKWEGVDGSKAGKVIFHGMSEDAARSIMDGLRDPLAAACGQVKPGTHKYVSVRLLSKSCWEEDLKVWQTLSEDERQSVELRLRGGARVTFFSDLEVKLGHPEVIDDRVVRPHAGIMIEPPSVRSDDADGTKRWMPAASGDEKLAVFRRISRNHCEFSLGCDDRPQVRDLNSANGTFFVSGTSGRRVRCGDEPAPLEDGELAFGSAASAFALQVRPFGDESRTGLCLSRKDGPVHYVLLWSDFDLGMVSRAYCNFIVRWDERQGRFLLLHEGDEVWLLPGREVSVSRFNPITVSKAWDK